MIGRPSGHALTSASAGILHGTRLGRHGLFSLVGREMMASFDELLGVLREPAEDTDFTTIYDDLSGIYKNAETLLLDKDNRIQELEAEISDLKYQIATMQSNDGDEDNSEEGEPDYDPDKITIDDLFEEDDED